MELVRLRVDSESFIGALELDTALVFGILDLHALIGIPVSKRVLSPHRPTIESNSDSV